MRTKLNLAVKNLKLNIDVDVDNNSSPHTLRPRSSKTQLHW